ncbi:MAG: transporter [Planctomycetes bacterium]|nr:transporter [Planctomycetota bacterium]
MRIARVGRLPIAVALVLCAAPAARAQFPQASTPVAGYADAPPAGTTKPGDMTALYDKGLTSDRPIKYGGLCCKKHKGCFQKETLFEWSVGCDPRKKDDEKDGADGDNEEPDDDERLKSDRPDFTEASSTIGRGRVQFEGGYTYIGDRNGGVRTRTHSYPEGLLRVGMFADWFELRLGQNVFAQSVTENGVRTTTTSASDLYVGAKLALTKQKGVLPEMAVILQGTVPSGGRAVTADRVLYGFNYLFSWDLNDTFSLAGSVSANKNVDDARREYVLYAQSLSIGYTLGKNLTGYTEWFALYPAFATNTGGGAQHYLDGGLQYFLTKNFALDVRIGVGLSRSADDLFAGAGFVVRY